MEPSNVTPYPEDPVDDSTVDTALGAAGQMREATGRIRAAAVELLPDTEDDLVIDLRDHVVSSSDRG